VCVDAPDLVFRSGWPSQITADEMKRYYCEVTKVLKPQTIPETQFNPSVLRQEFDVDMRRVFRGSRLRSWSRRMVWVAGSSW